MVDRIAFDRSTHSVRHVDENGYLHIAKSHASKEQVVPYYGREIPNYEIYGFEPDKIYYAYRPDGLRHSIGDKVHIWDGANIVADIDGSDVVVYIRGANLIYADDGNIIYYHFNAHGDVVALTNENGTKTKSYSYSAFGIEYAPSDLDDNPFRYCGEYFDKETNTIYLRARYYNAEQGRFTQEDPIRDGYNWYAYCGGNPVRFMEKTKNIQNTKNFLFERILE